MRQGITDEGETLRVQSAHLEGRPVYAVVSLGEGRKHEIKRLFAHFDLEVVRLLRVAVGPVRLADLPPGAVERVPPKEAADLLAFAERALLSAGGETRADL
jgi:23S rRNA pseudouridine2605 synthase